MAQPATIHGEIRERAKAMLGSSTHFVECGLSWRRLLADAEKLSKADVVLGSIEKAFLHHMAGDASETRYWIDNARQNAGALNEIRFAQMAMLSNLGFFSEAADLYSETVTLESNLLSTWFRFGCVTANFSDMLKNMGIAKRAKLELGAEKEMAMASQCDEVLRRLQVTEKQVQAILDVAGEVMREHKLFWLDDQPVVHSWSNEDGAGLLYELKVGLPADEAFSLTEAVIDRLIERELDAPGISFSFISTPQAPGAMQ